MLMNVLLHNAVGDTAMSLFLCSFNVYWQLSDGRNPKFAPYFICRVFKLVQQSIKSPPVWALIVFTDLLLS